MPVNTETKRRITKRLTPLYISIFFQSFVLWYAVEKLFMQGIGFNGTSIGIMIAAYSAVMLLVETPSGILADRWSRKGVLIIASIFLSLSALIGGLSENVSVYIVAMLCWGVFFACYTGIYDSILYDLLAEETEDNTMFEKYLGRLLAIDSLGLVLAGLLSGAIASWLGLRETYYLSIPLALVPIAALVRFREPTLHKLKVAHSIKNQIGITVDAVLKKKSLVPLITALILRATLIYMIFEFSQLWLLALDTPIKYYGIANALLLSSIAVGSLSASRFCLSKHLRMHTVMGILVLSLGALIFSNSLVTIIVSQFFVATCLEAMFIVLNRMLHDRLHSSVRAGASAATSTIGRIIIIPLALTFGYISNHYTVFTATYILFGLGVLLCTIISYMSLQNNRRGLEATTNIDGAGIKPIAA